MQDIIELIVYYAPTVLASAASLAVAIKAFRDFAGLKNECLDLKDLEEVKSELRQVLSENAELKKDLRKLVNKIDGIRRDKK